MQEDKNPELKTKANTAAVRGAESGMFNRLLLSLSFCVFARRKSERRSLRGRHAFGSPSLLFSKIYPISSLARSIAASFCHPSSSFMSVFFCFLLLLHLFIENFATKPTTANICLPQAFLAAHFVRVNSWTTG